MTLAEHDCLNLQYFPDTSGVILREVLNGLFLLRRLASQIVWIEYTPSS